MNTSVKMPSVTIRFIRSGPDNSESDDVLRITFSHYDSQNETMVNKCVFTAGDLNKKKQHEFLASPEEVMNYLSLVFKLLRRDDDPYDSVQVDLPAYPQFLFEVANFKPSKQRLILQAVQSVVFDWPNFASDCKDNACGRYFASCDCMEVDDAY